MKARQAIEIDMDKISFKHVSFNMLRNYITGRRMHYNCRLNLYTELVLSIGVFYRDVLCGGILVSRKDTTTAYIETWYSRDDRGKFELLKHVEAIVNLLGYRKLLLPLQRKWIMKLLNDGWRQDGDKLAYKSMINSEENDNEAIEG